MTSRHRRYCCVGAFIPRSTPRCARRCSPRFAGVDARAQSAEAFYRGKTLTMIVPADPGGSYDLHTRLVARHLGKFVPGRPNIVVQNMAGAGGLRAINFLYEKAAQDGTVLGMPVQENILADVLGGTEVRYKVPEFNWIGRLAPGVDMIVTWWTTGIRTITDATKVASLPIGATGPASGTSLYPLMLNALVGTRFDVIPGYKHNEMLLAVERGETAGAFTSLATLKTQFARWITDKRINVLVVFTPERVAEFPAAPTLTELATNTADRQVMGIFASAGAIGRSFMTAPNVPADRVAALRTAFSAMVEDAEFRAEIAKTHAEFGPLSGAALQKLIADTRNVPAAVLERTRAAVRR